MPEHISNLYNLSLYLAGGCAITALLSICYIINVIKLSKKQTKINEQLLKAEIYNLVRKKDIQ